MSTPNFVPGVRFRVYRSAGGSPETFTYMCLATTRTLTRANQFEDATANDCNQPLATAVRKSMRKSSSWDVGLSGKLDAAKKADMETDVNSDTPMRYQFIFDYPLAGGGGTYTGSVFYDSLEYGSTDNGIVAFTARLRGDDALVYAPAIS
jgi:hypothetical protein